VFHVNRWAAAFAGVAGDKTGDGLDCLKALVPAVKAVPGEVFGFSASRRLEKMLRESAAAAGFAAGDTTGGDAAAEYAIRFITLLVEKNLLGHIEPVLRRIEKIVDTKNGILEVAAESAFPLDGAFEEEFRRQILRRTGAAGIKVNRRVVPELLGGYRLRIGGFYIDASLKGRAEKMTAELANEK
jgi:F-type H+-transporting ATPase subunit delta